MITLDDALNRNYYFHQKTGEVVQSFVRTVFQTFLGYDFNTFIETKKIHLLKKRYTEEEALEKAYHQAVETCLRACGSIPKYRAEIKAKFREQPGLRGGITDEVIDKMKYNKLKTLRTNLGLCKRGRKVTTTEPAPQQTVAKAKETIKRQTAEETVKTIYTSNIDKEIEEEDYRDDCTYTLDEIRQMEGEDITLEEAISLGYHLEGNYEPPAREPRIEEDYPLPPPRIPTKEELVEAIIEDLADLPREYVEKTYWYIQDIKENTLGRKK